MEILHRGVEAGEVLTADAEHFVFSHGDGKQRLLVRRDARRLELLVEGDVRSTDHDGVDDVGLLQLDLVDERAELRVAERVEFFTHDRALEHVLDVFARDLARSARPDVVGADEIKRLRLLLLRDPVKPRDDLLRGFLAGVDDVLRLLQSLVESRVIEHPVLFLEDGQHRFA